jgi:20S proteasome alpha/beta subunit
VTVVLAIRCSEGVVLASDGQVTADTAGQPTKSPARKLFDVGGSHGARRAAPASSRPCRPSWRP